MSDDRHLGHETLLTGERGGRYPDGNSLLVAGSEETVITDPSLTVVARRDRLPRVDRVLDGHCHEDHVAGNQLFPDAPWLVHELDVPGLRSVDDLITRYGLGDPAIEASFPETVLGQFHYSPRPDAGTLRYGDVLDLGGGLRISVLHAPGHTCGHCVLMIEPDSVLYLGDIDLSPTYS